MNILVIGGCGYIGTHMVKALLAAGHDVVTLDNLSKGNRELLPGGAFVMGDINDPVVLEQVFSSQRFDAVMHFSAFIEVGESVQDPQRYYLNNVSGTLNLLKAMRRHGVNRFIFSSSAAVYGEPDYTPIDENHPCRPTSPYGRTKLMVEEILRDYDRAYGLRFIALRYFNAAGADPSGTIGERHDPESHLIPLVLKVATGERENVTIFGTDHDTPDGTCLRDYVHVNDLAAAHLLALKALQGGAPSAVYNLGNSNGISVNDVIETACRITGHPIPAVEGPRRPGDPAVLVARSDKARNELGWQPQFETLDVIVESAWKWHKSQAASAEGVADGKF
jgi:UDP-glucose 4-epimerase